MSGRLPEPAVALRDALRRSAGSMARAFLVVERRGSALLAHVVVLDHLTRSGTATVSELAELLDLSPSAASNMVERMVGSRLVTRTEDPVDRRVRVVAATEEGRQLMASAADALAVIFARWIDELPGDERRKLLAALAVAFSSPS